MERSYGSAPPTHPHPPPFKRCLSGGSATAGKRPLPPHALARNPDRRSVSSVALPIFNENLTSMLKDYDARRQEDMEEEEEAQRITEPTPTFAYSTKDFVFKLKPSETSDYEPPSNVR